MKSEIKVNDTIDLVSTNDTEKVTIRIKFPDADFVDEGLSIKVHADVNIKDLLMAINQMVNK